MSHPLQNLDIPIQFQDLAFKVAVIQPEGSVKGMVADRTKALVGQVVKVAPTNPYGKYQIPDCLITIKGRSGKQITVSFVESYAEIYPTWSEALKTMPKCLQ